MSKLALPTQEQQTATATLLGIYTPNPSQVVVDYKGRRRNWDISWLTQLEEEGRIKVLNDDGTEFVFVGGSSQVDNISDDDIGEF